MTQSVFADIDPSTKTGTQLATDLNNFKDSLLSSHLGTSSPSYSVEGTLWMDNTSSNLVAYVEDTDAANIPVFQVDATNHVARVAMDNDRDSWITASTDDQIDVRLGGSNLYSFKTSGLTAPGIYLGGTVAANLLDDYEEGTFTPSVVSSGFVTGTFSSYSGFYTKVGNSVFIDITISGTTMSWINTSGFINLSGLPFTPARESSGVFAAASANSVFGSAVATTAGNLVLTNSSISGSANTITATVAYKV